MEKEFVITNKECSKIEFVTQKKQEYQKNKWRKCIIGYKFFFQKITISFKIGKKDYVNMIYSKKLFM